MFILSVMPSSHLILWHPLLLLPSFPSIRVHSNESSFCIRWPKTWSFSFSISHSSEYSGLISLKIDWFDLLAVQETFRSPLQHHSSKILILWHSAFFTVQLLQPYVTTGKTITLIVQTTVSRVMSLLFNTQSRFIIAFLSRNNCLLTSWLQSPSAVILEPKKRKSVLSSVQSLSRVQLFATPWTAAHQASLSVTNSWVYSNSCSLSQWCLPLLFAMQYWGRML